MMRIAVDAMGGDKAPAAIIDGAVDAARKAKGEYEVVLVGDKPVIEKEFHQHHFIKDCPISIVHASQKVEMGESPSAAFRRKPDSSISVAMRMHKEGKVDAVVSARLFPMNRVSACFSTWVPMWIASRFISFNMV